MRIKFEYGAMFENSVTVTKKSLFLKIDISKYINSLLTVEALMHPCFNGRPTAHPKFAVFYTLVCLDVHTSMLQFWITMFDEKI